MLAARDGAALLNLIITYDKTGSVTGICNGTHTDAYGYDLLDRLINVKKNGAFAVHCTYDAGGRRVRSVDEVGVIDYVYSGLNVIDEVSGGAHNKHVYAGTMHLASNAVGTDGHCYRCLLSILAMT